jgi:hypothetical protein
VTNLLEDLNLRDPRAVIDTLRAGVEANLRARCRTGSTDHIRAGSDSVSNRLIATGDLHDNPLHLARLITAAALFDNDGTPAHLTLHEVIHGGTLVHEMDFSYRPLVRIAALKAAHPELVHTLLANHELSQIAGAGIVKDGITVVRAFNDAVEFSFRDQAPAVLAAIADFIRSMPLALRCSTPGAAGDILCAHSLPAPELMDRFDPAILERPLVEDDYQPRRGSAHLMVWGRHHSPDQLRSLADRWGVTLFILGHEKADQGALLVEPNAIVLNSDHDRGVYLDIDLSHPPSTPAEALTLARPLGSAP